MEEEYVGAAKEIQLKGPRVPPSGQSGKQHPPFKSFMLGADNNSGLQMFVLGESWSCPRRITRVHERCDEAAQ